MALKTRQTNTLQTVLKRQSEERLIVEEKLRNELVKYFTRLEKQALATYEKASEQGIPSYNIRVLFDLLFKDWHLDYTEILKHYIALNETLARRQIKELIEIQQKNNKAPIRRKQASKITPFITLNDNPVNELAVKASLDDWMDTGEEKKIYNYSIEPNPVTAKQLENATFQFSDKTKQRVNGEINDILKLTETEGLGPRQVGKLIKERFSKLKGYEAERIARTECLRASNVFRYDYLVNDDLLDYYQWYSNIDSKTRGQKKGDKANHIKMHREIVRKGELFSNGLRHPGDPNAPAYETINCRCTLVPYIVPWDKTVPAGLSHFHESDLIPLPEDNSKRLMLESLEATNFITPVSEGFQVAPSNLRINGQSLRQWLGSATAGITGGYLSNLGELKGHFQKYFSPHTPSMVKPGRKLHLEDIVRESKPYTPTRTPTPSPVGEVSSVFTKTEQASYDDLMNKLMSTGGQVRLKKGKPTIVGGDLTNAERKLLQQLHNKKLSPLHNPQSVNIPAPPVSTAKTQYTTHAKEVLTKKQLDKMDFKQLGEYYNAEYKGLVKYDYDGRQYHTFIEKVDGQEMFIRMEKDAIKTYTEGGVATPNEIIQEVLRVPKKHKYNTRGIWFKNNNYGIEHKATKTGYDSLPRNVKGYNSYYDVSKNRYHDDPDHEIVINPKHFKKSRGKIDSLYQQGEEEISDWQHTIRHEFAHSADTNMRRFREGRIRACYDEEYMQIHRAERDFTDYANTDIFESYAEHGGYVSAMLDHPEDHMKTITVEVMERGVKNIKHINFEEYKQMYPKHYEYFRKQCLEGL